MATKYIAGRRLKVDGRFVMPGEEVPQAATWRNLESYISFGSIKVVEAGDGEQVEEEPAPAPAPPAEEYALGEMLKDELVALAEERGLDTSGTKAELIERLS